MEITYIAVTALIMSPFIIRAIKYKRHETDSMSPIEKLDYLENRAVLRALPEGFTMAKKLIAEKNQETFADQMDYLMTKAPKPKQKSSHKGKRGKQGKHITLYNMETGETRRFKTGNTAAKGIGAHFVSISHLRSNKIPSLKGWVLLENAYKNSTQAVRCVKSTGNGCFKYLNFQNVVDFGNNFKLSTKQRTQAIKKGSVEGWSVTMDSLT